MISRQEIFAEIEKERAYQDTQWGTEFDNKNTLNDWAMYVVQQLGKATQHELPKEERRVRFMKAITLGIAALERDFDSEVAPRHYDNVTPNRPKTS